MKIKKEIKGRREGGKINQWVIEGKIWEGGGEVVVGR